MIPRDLRRPSKVVRLVPARNSHTRVVNDTRNQPRDILLHSSSPPQFGNSLRDQSLLTRSNAANGRKALYVGSHASHIHGMPEEEGRALLKELLEFATQEKFTYMHHWRVGDLVMYDNRAALHRARPYKITEHPRILHRTTVAGEGPTVAA